MFTSFFYDSNNVLASGAYVGGSGGMFHTLDSTGNVLLSTQIEDTPYEVRDLAISGDYCYVAVGTKLNKIDASGSVVWSFSSFGSYVNCVAIDASGFVYAAGNDNTVRKINAAGSQVWSQTVGFVGYDIRIDGTGDVWVCGAGSFGCRQMSASTGAEIRTYTNFTSTKNRIVVGATSIWLGMADGNVAQLRRSDGYMYWIENIGSSVLGMDNGDAGFICCGTNSASTIRKMNANTGAILWQHTWSVTKRNITVSGQDIFVAGGSAVRKLNSSGAEVFTSSLGNTTSSVAPGTVAVSY